jgi:hypothetical protein
MNHITTLLVSQTVLFESEGPVSLKDSVMTNTIVLFKVQFLSIE